MLTWMDKISPALHRAGQNANRSDWFDPRRIIYDHELMCFGSTNTHRIEFDDRIYELNEHTFIIIPPGKWHVCRARADSDIYRTWIHFDWVPNAPAAPSPILTYAPARPNPQTLRYAPGFIPENILHGSISNPAELFAKQRRLCRLHTAGDLKSRLKARALLLDILTDLLVPDSLDTPEEPKHIQPENIRHVLQTLAEYPFAKAPLLQPFLNEQFNRSYDHLCRLFKQQYGTTPLQYVNALRMERARHLLSTTSKPASEIARDLGFADPVYFHRLFRNVIGQTPGAFRARPTTPGTD